MAGGLSKIRLGRGRMPSDFSTEINAWHGVTTSIRNDYINCACESRAHASTNTLKLKGKFFKEHGICARVRGIIADSFAPCVSKNVKV